MASQLYFQGSSPSVDSFHQEVARRAYAEYLAACRDDGRLAAIAWLQDGLEDETLDGDDIAMVMAASALGDEANVEGCLEFEGWMDAWDDLFDCRLDVYDFVDRFSLQGLNDDALYQFALGYVEGLIQWWHEQGESLCCTDAA